MDLIEKQSTNNNAFVINWIYFEEDDISEEMGEDFQEDFPNLTINLISKK